MPVSTDLTGKRFGRLLVQYRTPDKDAKGYYMWHCICDCGNEIDVSYNNLVHANQTSCGCKKKENVQMLRDMQEHVDGTSLEHLKSNKVPTNNTTGVRGVYLIRGKYVAKVVFRKKAYYLGKYETLEEAAEVRKKAEELLFQSTVEYHAKWKERADEDPAWANENPMQIFVKKEGEKIHLSFLPVLD